MSISTDEAAIPASFFDMPIDFGSHVNLEQDPLQGLTTSEAFATISDLDAMAAGLAASGPLFEATQEGGATAASTSASATTQVPAPLGVKTKKTSKPKSESGEPKPKKQKKKASAEASAEGAVAPAKPKKATSKKKAADKDMAGSNAASPAPFAASAGPDKAAKPKKGAVLKGRAKGAAKGRSTTAQSDSRISSVGRDIATPALSRVGSQRPPDRDADDEEPPPPRAAADDDEEDVEADADDGVEELGKDHFSTQEAIYAAQQRNMGLLSMVMDEVQLDRHMASRRGALNKTSVRKVSTAPHPIGRTPKDPHASMPSFRR
jgi:hypothetical protein